MKQGAEKGRRSSDSHKTLTEIRTVDRYFAEFDAQSQHPGNRALQYIFMPIWCFALLGLIWMIPFPELAFLKERGYHIFLNWASFLIAFVVYYYLRLAPTLSYAVLLSIGLASYLIVQMEYAEAAGGLPVLGICTVLLLGSSLVLWFGNRAEERPASFMALLKHLVHAPIWMWHFAFKRFNLPY